MELAEENFSLFLQTRSAKCARQDNLYFTPIIERRRPMAFKNIPGKPKREMRCHRCGGCMVFEKFYGENSSYTGWRCMTCGDILDPVILLHRATNDAAFSIPEKEEDIIPLIRKYAPRFLKNMKKG
jgi:hypothetical protein